MTFQGKKTENCFADAQTWEYVLPVSGAALSARLSGWEVRRNTKLRRPVFIAERNGVQVKGVLEGHAVKVSFPSKNWEAEKDAFEKWLERTDV